MMLPEGRLMIHTSYLDFRFLILRAVGEKKCVVLRYWFVLIYF